MREMVDIAKDYDNFSVPVADIKINDESIITDSLYISDIVCMVNMDMGASTTTINMKGARTKYQKKLEIDNNLKQIKLGDKIEVDLGYTTGQKEGADGEAESINKLKPVFMGIVTKISYDFSGQKEVKVSVECMDAKELMMHNILSANYEVDKTSAVFKQILDPYSAYYKEVKIEDTNDGGDKKIMLHRGLMSDFNYLCDIAKQLNYFFYISKNVVHIGKIDSIKDVDIKIKPGTYLQKFKKTIDFHDQVKEVNVVGMDKDGGETIISGTATLNDVSVVGNGKKSVSDATNVMQDYMKITIIDHNLPAPEVAKSRALAELEKIAINFVKGSFTIAGTPDMEVGTLVQFEGLNDEFDGQYLVTSIKHNFTTGEYTTTCEFGGNKL